MRGGSPIQRCFERRQKLGLTCDICPWIAWRGHLTGAELVHDFLEHFGVRADVVEIERFKRQPRRLQTIVVTSETVTIDERAVRDINLTSDRHCRRDGQEASSG